MFARAILLTILSVFACSALLVGGVVLAIHAAFFGAPFSTSDWVGTGIVAGLSLITLVVAGRAAQRSWAGQDTGVLSLVARGVPLLVLAGTLAGGAGAWSIINEQTKHLGYTFERACEAPQFFGIQASACQAIAERCLREAWRRPHPSDDEIQTLRAAIASVTSALSERERLERADFDGDADRFARNLASELNEHSFNARSRHGMYLCMWKAGTR